MNFLLIVLLKATDFDSFFKAGKSKKASRGVLAAEQCEIEYTDRQEIKNFEKSEGKIEIFKELKAN